MAGKIIGAIVGGLALWLLSWATSEGAVRGRVWRPVIRRPACVGGNCGQSVTVTTTTVAASTPDRGDWFALAKARAEACAERMAVGHFLGCPAGCFEGAGMATTEDGAIRNCCFWGTRPVRAVATCQRGGWWFACTLYE